MSLCSCTRYITPPVTGQNNIGYIYRPFYKDSSQSKTNISLGYGIAASSDGYLEHQMGLIDISRGHSLKNFNFGYGVFMNAGKSTYNDDFRDYSDNTATNYHFKSNFNNVGIRTTIGYHKASKSGKTNFRLINWENAFSIERGKFVDYRKNIQSDDFPSSISVYVSNLSKIYTTGFSTEILRNNAFGNPDMQFSIRLFLGGTANLGRSLRDLDNPLMTAEAAKACFITSYALKYKKLHVSMECGSDINYGSKFLLGYSF